MINRHKLLTAAALAVGLATASVGVIHAQSATGTNPMSNLVTAIAQKFNLNQADVQQVFDDQHAQMEAQRQQEFKDRLAQAVTDGKLTQEQADKIVAKQAELESQREANKTAMESMTEEQRREAMKTQMDSLKQWATDNSIPAEFSFFGGFGGRGKGPGGFGGRHFAPPAAEQN